MEYQTANGTAQRPPGEESDTHEMFVPNDSTVGEAVMRFKVPRCRETPAADNQIHWGRVGKAYVNAAAAIQIITRRTATT